MSDLYRSDGQGATLKRSGEAATLGGADPRGKRRTFLRAALLLAPILLYIWFRYATLSMEHSHFPESFASPIARNGEKLVTFQAGDEDGCPVVFVHGTPGAADNWAHFLHYTKPGFRSIAVDRPGFGESTPGAGLARLRDQAAALRPLLESLRGRNPILVGHSLGGPIIAQAALDYPDLVGGLAMVAASMDPSVEKIFAVQYLGDLPGLRLILPRMLRNSNRELLPLRADLEALFPRLNEVTCPVTMVHGTEDLLVPFENVAYMEKAFPANGIHAIVVLEGENHFLPWTAEESIWDAVEGLAAARPR